MSSLRSHRLRVVLAGVVLFGLLLALPALALRDAFAGNDKGAEVMKRVVDGYAIDLTFPAPPRTADRNDVVVILRTASGAPVSRAPVSITTASVTAGHGHNGDAKKSTDATADSEHSMKMPDDTGHSMKMPDSEHSMKMPDSEHSMKMPDDTGHSMKMPDSEHSMKMPDDTGHSMKMPDSEHSMKMPDSEHSMKMPDDTGHSMKMPDSEHSMKMPDDTGHGSDTGGDTTRGVEGAAASRATVLRPGHSAGVHRGSLSFDTAGTKRVTVVFAVGGTSRTASFEIDVAREHPRSLLFGGFAVVNFLVVIGAVTLRRRDGAARRLRSDTRAESAKGKPPAPPAVTGG